MRINPICELLALQGLFELAAKTYKSKQRRQQQQGGKRRPSMTGTVEFLDAPPSESAATLQLQVRLERRTLHQQSTQHTIGQQHTTAHDRDAAGVWCVGFAGSHVLPPDSHCEVQARLASEAPDRFPAAATNALSDRFPATAASAMSMLTRGSRRDGGSGAGGSSNGSHGSSGSGVEMAPDLYGMPAPGARGRRPRQQPSSSDEDTPDRTKKRPGQLRRARREIDSW